MVYKSVVIMYYLSASMCRILYNVIVHPWECLTEHDPVKMCDDLRNVLSGVDSCMFFDVITHPVMRKDGIVNRAYVTVMSKEPELVLGVVSRVVLRDMVLTLYFTDEFGDLYTLNSVSFRTTGTEGMRLDSLMDGGRFGPVGIK